MQSSKEFSKCFSEIEETIKTLSNKISNSSVDWREKNFEKITKSISNVANKSREVIEQAENTWKAIEGFEDYED